MLRALDLFSCVGCHAIGLQRAGIETSRFVELEPARRAVLSRHFPEIAQHDDVHTYRGKRGEADIVIGGPPCQGTSVAAAIHGYRSGDSLWPEQFRICRETGVSWVVVEQPTGHAGWEAEVAHDLIGAGYHVARFEFEARDVGAPFERRRVFILACTSLPRLEVAWASGPSAIDRVKRAADARGTWDAGQLRTLRVDARSAGEMDRSRSRGRVARIEALGDSNPPEMAEVIGLMLTASTPADGEIAP
jgi:site-specific DNA-cytosine methylase